jgi:hypothetical protein
MFIDIILSVIANSLVIVPINGARNSVNADRTEINTIQCNFVS